MNAADPDLPPRPEDVAATGPVQDCPFPGLASYDHDRRQSFRGRETEAPSLAAALLGRRLSVLTAGSGDGKTSLIHAALVPLMLSEGIEVAVGEPGGKAPLQEIGRLCLDRLLPGGAVQLPVIERLIARYGGNITLRDGRTKCLTLPIAEKQRLLDGGEAVRPLHCLAAGPMVSWLRDPGVPDLYLNAAAAASLDGSNHTWPGVDAKLTDLREVLQMASAGEPLAPADDPKATRLQLVQAMDKAIRRRCRADDDFEIVLFLDQFEEIFVRFRQVPEFQDEAGADGGRQRDALFGFIQDILEKPWPLRLVLSLRKEHYADLQTALAGVQALEASTYHLGPLGVEQARESLTQGATWPGQPPTDGQAKAIVDALAVERRVVYPALLSVVGEWLWENPDWTSRAEHDAKAVVTEAIDDFVQAAFNPSKRQAHEWSADELCEAMDLLDQLIIRSGSMRRRDSVAEAALLHQPLRCPDLRKKILEWMENGRILRRETRFGGELYIEVVHEAMIDPCLSFSDDVRSREPDLADLPRLVDDLRTEARESFPAISPLRSWQAKVLIANIDRLDLPPVLAARTLTRLLLNPDLQELDRNAERKATIGADRPTWREVLRVLGKAAAENDRDDDRDIGSRRLEGRFVSPAEADILLALPETRNNRGTIELIAGSALAHRDSGAPERIRSVFKALRGMEAA